MSQCGYRYYQRFPIVTGDVRNVLAISKACGPGYLEFWSPDAFVKWTVTQTGDGKADPRNYRTGPASTSGVYLPHGGELVGEVVGEARAHINEYNGAWTREPLAPEVRAKFYPEISQRPKLRSQRFVVAGNSPAFDFPPVAPILPLDMAYPPKYSHMGAVSSDGVGGACLVEIVNALDNVARISRAVNITSAFPFTCGAWEFMRVTNGGNPPLNIQILWSEEMDVYV